MKHNRTRKAIAALTLLLASTFAGGVAPAANAAPSSASSTDCVKQYPVTRVDSITPAGVEVAATPGLATLSHYDTGHPGDDLREVTPPTGWTPIKATDQELRTYGFPPRPTTAQALSTWTADLSTWRGAGAPGMCETALMAGVTHTATSLFWAGGMAVNGTPDTNTFWTTDDQWQQPAFGSNVCSSNATYVAWGGLGGFNHPSTARLLQSGTMTGSNLVSNMFWEAISQPLLPNGAVKWTDSAGTVHGGDALESWVYYSNPWASLSVIDHTTGQSHNMQFSTYNGSPAAGYWDGTTAEMITEAPVAGGVILDLLKPATGQTLSTSLTVNGQPNANFPSWRILQQDSGILVDDTNFDGIHQWLNTWKRCHFPS